MSRGFEGVVKPRSLSVMSTLAVLAAFRDRIGPAFEQAAPVALSITYDPTAVLTRSIAEGRRADVIVAINSAVAEIVSAGVLLDASRVDIARTGIGLAERPGSDTVDISTPKAFVAALRSATSIVFSQSGASGIAFASLIERLGIAAEIREKATVIPKGFTAERLLTGEAELAVQQVSELRAIPGVDIVGPFPEPYQTYTTFSAATFREAQHPEEAGRFLDYLKTDLAAAAFAAAGLEPLIGISAIAGGLPTRMVA